MKVASRFLPRSDRTMHVCLTIDGQAVAARPSDTIAAALLAHSGDASRQSATGAPRTAFCMMGVCFDCLVEVDGLQNTQACLMIVREGMVVRRQYGLRALAGGCADA